MKQDNTPDTDHAAAPVKPERELTIEELAVSRKGTDGLIPLTSTEPGLEAIDLDCVTGGRGEINDYGDLSHLVYHGSEKHRMTPAERLNKFLYGGAMAKGDRATLIRNWEENNGRTAPPRIEGTPERDW